MDQFDDVSLAIVLIAVALFVLYLLWRDRPRHREHHHRAVRGTLTMSKQLNVGAVDTATVTYTDKAGNPAVLPAGNIPAWTSDTPAVATVVPAADGMSAQLTAVAVGTANITVVAEGDPTPGVDTITLSGSVNVVDEASGGVLTL